MKRYRTSSFSFDSRANTLSQVIEDSWDPVVKTSWQANKKHILEDLEKEFGVDNLPQKIKNFTEIGASFPSIIFFHNRFLAQARKSFVIGAYYPALTGITTLTERILNHLIITLRGDFSHTKEYKKVSTGKSFTNWVQVIDILTKWDILLPEAKPFLDTLKNLRHEFAAHFNPVTDYEDRKLALEAIEAFQEFIRIQFGSLGLQPWFIENTKGEFFIKKEYENHPFVKRIYLPNCVLVGPRYEFIHTPEGFKVKDEEYENVEITDAEFVKLREAHVNHT